LGSRGCPGNTTLQRLASMICQPRYGAQRSVSMRASFQKLAHSATSARVTDVWTPPDFAKLILRVPPALLVTCAQLQMRFNVSADSDPALAPSTNSTNSSAFVHRRSLSLPQLKRAWVFQQASAKEPS